VSTFHDGEVAFERKIRKAPGCTTRPGHFTSRQSNGLDAPALGYQASRSNGPVTARRIRNRADFLDVIEGPDYTLVPISAEVALDAGRFPSDQRDPFDRVIAAQAFHEDIPVLSSDGKLDTFLVRRIW
jgi:hypothetical protein